MKTNSLCLAAVVATLLFTRLSAGANGRPQVAKSVRLELITNVIVLELVVREPVQAMNDRPGFGAALTVTDWPLV